MILRFLILILRIFFKSNVHILVFGYEDLGDSYIFSGDGLTKSSPNIFAPQTDYMKKSVSAIVKGEMYIFGTYQDDQKVYRLFLRM